MTSAVLKQRGSPNIVIPMIRDSLCLSSLQQIDASRVIMDNLPASAGRLAYFEDSHTQETAWAMAPVRPTPFIVYIVDASAGVARDNYFDCIRSLAPTCALMLLVFCRVGQPIPKTITDLPSGFFLPGGVYQPAFMALQYDVKHEKRNGVQIRMLHVPHSPENLRSFQHISSILERTDMPAAENDASGHTTFRLASSGSAMGSRGSFPTGSRNRMTGMPHVVIEAEESITPAQQNVATVPMSTIPPSATPSASRYFAP